MPDIILCLGSSPLLSPSTTPPKHLQKLSLAPPTAFCKALTTALSTQHNVATTSLHDSRLFVAEPPVAFPHAARLSIAHAARRLRMRVTFYSCWDCVNAVMPCTAVVDISDVVIVYDAARVESCETVSDVGRALAELLEARDIFDRASANIAIVGKVEKGDFVEIRSSWNDVMTEARFQRLRRVGLKFLACSFDPSVVVWAGAAVLAVRGVGEKEAEVIEYESLLRG